jgi:hypothetical protein
MRKSSPNKPVANKPNIIPIEDIKNYGKSVNCEDTISNVFFKISGVEKTMSGAYFTAQICTADGNQVPEFTIEHSYKTKRAPKVRQINEACFFGDTFQKLVKQIQSGEIGKFPKITMFAQERSIEYDPNKEHDRPD